jgi:predicted nucleic acid-binding protein
MTLVDTSVWIDFFRGIDLPHVQRLEALIQQGENIALCGLILTEILQGIRDDNAFERTQTRLEPLLMLPMTKPIFVQAAVIYRTLRGIRQEKA